MDDDATETDRCDAPADRQANSRGVADRVADNATRRRFLALGGATGVAALAGCSAAPVGSGSGGGTLTVATYSNFIDAPSVSPGEWLKEEFESRVDAELEWATPDNEVNYYVERTASGASIDADLYVGLTTEDLVRVDETLDDDLFAERGDVGGFDDVREGIGDTDVRAGIIGELGVSGEIHDEEEKVLRAGARAALETGASVTVHPTGRGTVGNKNQTYPSSRWGLDILDVLTGEGLPPSRVVVSHMDRDRFELTAESLEYQRELADRGAYLEYDLWGNEKYYTPHFDKKPSDPERVEAVVELVEDGYTDRLLFSHDVAFKDQLVTYGGFGYGHILEHVVPMLRMEDLTTDQITTILTENPREMLTFAEPA